MNASSPRRRDPYSLTYQFLYGTGETLRIAANAGGYGSPPSRGRRQKQQVPRSMTDTKPYRPNVGVALFNASGRVLIGRRFRDDGPEIILPGLEWQMPQGGIDEAENPREAVMRELWEETGVSSAD